MLKISSGQLMSMCQLLILRRLRLEFCSMMNTRKLLLKVQLTLIERYLLQNNKKYLLFLNLIYTFKYYIMFFYNLNAYLKKIAKLKKCAEFRKFWGSKSELRRFQDSTICETVLFEMEDNTVSGRRLVYSNIIKHILKSYL